MNDFITAAAEQLERHAARQDAEADKFGKLVNEVGGNRFYERFDDGQLISTLVCSGGALVYEIVGLRWAELC